VSRLLEHDAKRLLAGAGISVPRGEVVSSAAAAGAFARLLPGDVVVKALVPANRRAKSGLVVFAAGSAAEAEAAGLFSRAFEDAPIERLLVEERVAIERELFFSITLDKARKSVVALASLAGGVEIEQTSAESPHLVGTIELDSLRAVQPHSFRGLWSALGLSGPALPAVVDVCMRATRVFFESEATILELNPLALVTAADAGVPRVVAVGAVIAVDDSALARHPELEPLALPDKGWRPPTRLERQALDVAAFEPYRGTARFIELEGDIALLVGGGGGSLVFFDAVQRAGGRPACYTEIGGNPSAEKVRRLTRVVLSCPGVRGLLVGHNITNNTQVDLIAAGVVQALEDLGLDARRFPVVAREVGTHDEVGRTIFEQASVEYLGEEATMDDAARLIVSRVAAAST
jgi:succinyl-CoA synthetase beta subunit/citryl-CoA synthetase large subunit